MAVPAILALVAVAAVWALTSSGPPRVDSGAPAPDPVETLLGREGATARADDVRVLNRLEGNPTLPAGRVLKIPVGGVLPGGS